MKKLSSLLMIFLFSLFFLFTLGCKYSKSAALHLFGGNETIGANVYLNGKMEGKMEKFGDKSAHFSKWLPYGNYQITVEKMDYLSYKENIVLKPGDSEYYLEVSLTSSKSSKSR